MIRLDIEVYEEWGEDTFAQAKYLVHGYDDVLWTNSIDDALRALRSDLVDEHHGRITHVSS